MKYRGGDLINILLRWLLHKCVAANELLARWFHRRVGVMLGYTLAVPGRGGGQGWGW